MGHRILQAKQRQQQNFQQQENSNILYSVNWAAENNGDVIINSTWVQNNGSGSIEEVVALDLVTSVSNSISSEPNILDVFIPGMGGAIETGSYIQMKDLTGNSQELIDLYEGRRVEVLTGGPSVIKISLFGLTGTITSGIIDVLADTEGKTASARLKGNVGTSRFTNKITTESGNIMERQLVVRVLSNTDRLADDYFYYGRRGF